MWRVNAAKAIPCRVSAPMVLILLMTLWGCAAVWQPVQGRQNAPGWSIALPDGWMHFATPAYDMYSKDGPYLQYILVQERPLTQEFHFTTRTMAVDMLPHEMAGIIIDNLRADPQIRNFSLVSSAPVMVAGRPGFKLIYTYQDRQGVEMQTIYYGTVHMDRFFNLRYTATKRHYFAADRDTFEQVARSLRLTADI